jgi:hypothetical protein
VSELAPVGIGDLVNAVRVLGLRGEQIATAAELLRLRPRVLPEHVEPDATAALVSSPSFGLVLKAEGTVGPARSIHAASPDTIAVSAIETPAVGTEAPLAARTLAELLPERTTPPPAARGLFASSSRRALLRGVTAVRAPEGEVDVDAVVERLAGNRALDQIPLEWIESTRGEVQLLLDTGAAMDPFRLDVDRLPDELARVVGEDGLSLCWFEDCPTGRAGVQGLHDEEPLAFRQPAAGTRLLVVTAFGSRGQSGAPPALVDEWRRFGAACRRGGVPLLVLTPLPHLRVPAALRLQLALVTWDRSAGVRDVRRAVRRARRR